MKKKGANTMKKIETYGIKIDMKSLEEAARTSENYMHTLHNSFYWNSETGEIYCSTDQSSNQYNVFDNYYHFYDSYKHMTQQAIVDVLNEFLMVFQLKK